MSNRAEDLNAFIEKVFYHFEKEDHKKIDIDYLKNIQLSDSECLYLFNLQQNRILYKKGFTQCLGYDEDIISFDFLIKNIHPDDSELVQRVTKATILYCIDHPDDSINNQLFITYRHKTKKGNYVKILNHISIFDVDNKGTLKTILIRLLNISFLDNTNNVNWTFKAKGLDKVAFKENIYKHTSDFFTPRELELIHEIVKGFTNKEIGIHLNISEHTVATHRKNILKKSDCHNFLELEVFCKGKGIL